MAAKVTKVIIDAQIKSPILTGHRTTPEPLPTYTPYPTYTPQPTSVGFTDVDYVLFSFYDPLIGKDKPEIRFLNCEKWNDSTQDCDSAMRSGDNFRDFYSRAAACPLDWYNARAVFKVLHPEWLAKIMPEFECLDTGGAVVHPYVDFLIRWKDMPFEYAKIPWRTPVILQRTR